MQSASPIAATPPQPTTSNRTWELTAPGSWLRADILTPACSDTSDDALMSVTVVESNRRPSDSMLSPTMANCRSLAG